MPEFVVYHLEPGNEDDSSNVADTSGRCPLLNLPHLSKGGVCLWDDRKSLSRVQIQGNIHFQLNCQFYQIPKLAENLYFISVYSFHNERPFSFLFFSFQISKCIP